MMGREQSGEYGDHLSGAADRLGRELAETGRLDDALGKEAARAGDLFHPRLWSAWQQARGEDFKRGVALLRPEEIERLNKASSQRGWSWALSFAMQPERMLALRDAGLDPSARACRFESSGPLKGRVSAAVFCCWDGWVSALSNMAEAGFEPPGALEPGAGAAEGARSALQALASRAPAFQKMRSGQWSRVIGWLSSAPGAETGVRGVNEQGDDALKLAIRSGAPEMAEELLAAGARASDENARGQSAIAVWQEAAALAAERDDEWAVAHLKAFEPALRAALERECLEKAAGFAPRSGARLRV